MNPGNVSVNGTDAPAASTSVAAATVARRILVMKDLGTAFDVIVNASKFADELATSSDPTKVVLDALAAVLEQYLPKDALVISELKDLVEDRATMVKMMIDIARHVMTTAETAASGCCWRP